MKLPLFVACLVAGSTWSFAIADVPTTTQNPKTAVKEIGNPKLQATPGTMTGAKVAPVLAPIPADADWDNVDPSGKGTSPYIGGSLANQQLLGTVASNYTSLPGILGVVAVPANDECATPQIIGPIISGSNLFAFDTTLATTGVDGQTAGTFGCNSQTYANLWDVWYEWTAPWTQFATIQTCGQTAVDTKLVVWQGAGCPSAAFLACSNNPTSCAPQSQVLNLWVTAGTTYMIQLGSSAQSGGQPPGTGNLEIIQFQPPPSPAEDNCATALALTGLGPWPFDNTGATEDVLNFPTTWCGTSWGHDLWYSWVAPSTSTFQLQTCDYTGLDSMLAIFGPYASPQCPVMVGLPPVGVIAAEIACNDDGCGPGGPSNFQFAGIAGMTYMIRVGGWNHENSALGILQMYDSSVPFNEDNCATPDTVVLGSNPFVNVGSTTGAQGQAESLCSFDGFTGIERDSWYTWTDSGVGGCTKIGICGGYLDSKIAVYAGAGCPSGSALVCNDDACGTQSRVNFIATPGATYTIQLGCYPGILGGTGVLDISQFPVGLLNDDCSGAVTVLLGTTLYNNATATTGCQGQAELLCNEVTGTGMIKDLWFNWVAPLVGNTGWAQVTTCSVSTRDTKLAVYSGAGCPTGLALACRDNSCGGTSGQSTIIFPVTAGTTYAIQVGTSPVTGKVAGSSAFTISQVPHPLPCAPWDDGTTDLALGAFGPNDYGWMNRFGDANNTVTVNSVDIAYGAGFSPLGVPNGTPTEIWVWQDGPEQDGNPINAQLLLTDSVLMQNVSTDILNNYVLSTPITVTGYFFVGTHVYNANGIIANVSGYTLPYDRTFHDWAETSWKFRADGIAAVANASNLALNTVPVNSAESSGYYGQHTIRVNCSQGPTNTFCQPGFGITMPCPCGNPPSGLGRGCNNKNSSGGAHLTATGSTSFLDQPWFGGTNPLVFTDTFQNGTGTQTSIMLQSKTGGLINSGAQFGHGVKCFTNFLRMYNHSAAPYAVAGTYVGPVGPWSLPTPGVDLDIVGRSIQALQTIPAGAVRMYAVYYRDNVTFPGPYPALCTSVSGGQNISDGQWCVWLP